MYEFLARIETEMRKSKENDISGYFLVRLVLPSPSKTLMISLHLSVTCGIVEFLFCFVLDFFVSFFRITKISNFFL